MMRNALLSLKCYKLQVSSTTPQKKQRKGTSVLCQKQGYTLKALKVPQHLGKIMVRNVTFIAHMQDVRCM